MFLVISLVVLLIGLPIAMFGLASIASYVGITQVVSGGLGAIVLFSSLPVPAAAIVSVTIIAVYLVYCLINNAAPTDQ